MAPNPLHFETIRALLNTDQPAELGPGPRAGVQAESGLRKSLEEVLGETTLAGTRGQLLLALILLWHDHLASAHTIAQQVENADGSFIHGIMHRREPDFANAKYCFRRVGEHPAFPELARRVTMAVTPSRWQNYCARLLPSGRWDPFIMVDMCAQAATEPAELTYFLRQVQMEETEVLLRHLTIE